MKQKSILISGWYVWDKISERVYPNGPADPRNYTIRTLSSEPGGTAGNIACLMAYYGWKSYPQAHLDTSRYGWALTRAMKAWGCDVRFVKNDAQGKTTIYHEERRLDKNGIPATTRYSRGGWGSMFGAHKYLRARDEAPAFAESLGFVPDVFFFDAPEAGNAALGAALKEKGALVYFEPEIINGNEESTKKTMSRIDSCSVMKFSRQSLPDTSFCSKYNDKLFIQTCDKDGVRFSLKGGEWKSIPAASNDHVVDALGAGDTTTAAFLNALAQMDALSMDKLTEDIVAKALEEAMRVASESVSYEGAKGYYWHLLGEKAQEVNVQPSFDQMGEGLREYKGKILYMHGSCSCGNSRTPGLLSAALPDYEIIAPDIPADVYEAIDYLKKVCDEVKPDLIVGSSMGAFFAQKMIGWKRICCNPALHMTGDVDFKEGKHSFPPRVDRLDGAKSYTMTRGMLDRYLEVEAHQLENIPKEDKGLCWGVFADHDTEVTDGSRQEFTAVYPHWVEYHGEHMMSKENIEECVAPLIRKILK